MIQLFNIIILFIFLYFIILKKNPIISIETDKKILIFLHLLTIFVINDSVNSLSNTSYATHGYSHYFPDQSRYLDGVIALRENVFSIFNTKGNFYMGHHLSNYWYDTNESMKGSVKAVIIFYSFSPFIVVPNDLIALNLTNYLLFLFLFIFLVRRNYNQLSQYIYLFIPSIFIFHSLVLKDFLLIFCVFFYFSTFFERRYLLSLLILFLIYFFRPHLSYFILFSAILHSYFFVIRNLELKYKYIFSILIILSIIIISNAFEYQILTKINEVSKGFFSETDQNINEYHYYKNYTDLSLSIFLNLLYVLLGKISSSVFETFSVIENFIITSIILYNYIFYKLYKKLKYNILGITILFYYSFLSVTVFNSGAIDRYKLPLEITLLLFSFYFTHDNYKKLIND